MLAAGSGACLFPCLPSPLPWTPSPNPKIRLACPSHRSASERLRLSSRPPPFSAGSTCQTFRPHRGITRRVHIPWRNALHFVPPSGFLSPSAVSSALRFAGLFHPAATSRIRFLRSGVFPPAQPPSLIERSSLLAVACAALAVLAPDVQSPQPQPRGLAPRQDPLRLAQG